MKFSTSWKSSTQPRKQRKYVYNAPLHVKQSFLGSHLSKELRTKYGVRSLNVRTGDKVKVMRGQHKGKSGKVERIDIKKSLVFIEGIAATKRDGNKAPLHFNPSNLMITGLHTDDKRRMKRLDSKAGSAKAPAKEPKPAAKPVEKAASESKESKKDAKGAKDKKE